MKLIKSLPGYKPLAVVGASLVLSRGRQLFISDLDLNSLVPLATLPARRGLDILSKFRIFDRILRLSITTMLVTPDKIAFANIGDEIWRIDIATKEVSLDFVIPKGRKSLNLSHIKNIGSYKDVIVFGDYFANCFGPMLGTGLSTADPPAVHIWARSANGSPVWNVLASFAGDDIDHIHNVVHDVDGNRIFALIGDTGNGVGFWEWSQQAQKFIPFQTGQQSNRSTWAIVESNEMIYATDTQLEQNYLMKSQLQNKARPEVIAEIDGSSIYSARTLNRIVFSTSVEPGRPSGSFIKDALERRPGPGIKGTKAKIYLFDPKAGDLAEVFSAEKDAIPLRLGQFGSFMFPTGMESLDDRFFAYGNAVKECDNTCLLFRG